MYYHVRSKEFHFTGDMVMYRKEISKEFLIKEYVENNRSTTEIANELGLCSRTILDRLKDYGIKTSSRGEAADLLGKTVGFLKVLERIGSTSKPEALWKCECICGNIIEKPSSKLIRRKWKSCGCKGLGRNGIMPNYFYVQIQQNFRVKEKQGLLCNISYEDCCELFITQNGFCNLSGLEIMFASNRHEHHYHNGTTASLDRINNNIGYIKTNCQWVHKDINRIKHTFTQDNFIEYCKLISNFSKQYNYEEICENLTDKKFSRIISKAKENKKDFQLNYEYLNELYHKQNGYCALTGLKISMEDSASLDRIDSEKPYIFNNVQWVHKDVNRMKNKYNLDYFLKLCKSVAEYNN